MDRPIEQLWEKVLDGDHQAWSGLVHRYSALVHTVGRRVGLSSFDVEDCAQQTWLALYRNRKTIKDPVRLPAWLILTMKRHAVRLLQRRRRQGELARDINPGEVPVVPDEELLRLERQDALEHAITRIDGRCRELLLALFFNDECVSYREIARKLKVSPNTLGPMRSRCLKRLREILEEMGYGLHE